MFDRFTDRARKVMGLARQAAARLHHDYIDPEHMLLGLAEEGSGVGVSVLRNLGVDLDALHQSVESQMRPGKAEVTRETLPFTARSKEVLESCRDEAIAIGHGYLGTEHLLLGLLCQRTGIAADVLRSLRIELQKARSGVRELLGDTGSPSETDQVSADGVGAAARLTLDSIGSGHILLWLLDQHECVATRALLQLGVDLDTLRAVVRSLLEE